MVISIAYSITLCPLLILRGFIGSPKAGAKRKSPVKGLLEKQLPYLIMQ
jgi:hypothetical protein